MAKIVKNNSGIRGVKFFIFLIVASWAFFGWPGLKQAQAAQVTFVAAGTGSGVAGNVTPAYPSGLVANDLILLQVTVRNTTSTPTTPAGFTLLYGPDSTGAGRQWIYYKISDGTESGTITVTTNATVCCIGRMYAFRNVDTSSFTEGGGLRTNLAIFGENVTTSVDKDLAVSFNFVNDDQAVGSFTGESGGDWTEAVAEFTTTAGTDGCVQLQTATMATAGTIVGGSYTMAAFFPWGVRSFGLKPAASTQVTFVAAGTGSGVAGNVTPAYPSGLVANDLILLQVTVRNTTGTPTTPAGFTLLYGPDSTGTGRQWIYYKISDGTESGTITVTTNAIVCCIGRMYAFRNAATSTFTESGGFGTMTKIRSQPVTTTDVERLAVSFVFVTNDNAVGSFTGESGGDWTEAVAEFTTTAGSDGCVQLQTATMATAGTITEGIYTMSLFDSWGVRGFALKPQVITLSISVSPLTWGVGTVDTGTTQVSTSGNKIGVTNDGNVAETFTLQIYDEDDRNEWTHSSLETGAGNNVYVLSGIFCATADSPTQTSFNETDSEDVLTTTQQTATSTKFAYTGGSANAVAVAVSGQRSLWLRLDMPTAVSGTYAYDQHTVTVRIGCQQS